MGFDRHIRWNWERSPEDNSLVRYHFVVVDDKDREGILNRILSQLVAQSPLIPVRQNVEGKVEGTDYRYLFESYDSLCAPRILDWRKIKKEIVKDRDLRERKSGSDGIVNYVENLFSK